MVTQSNSSFTPRHWIAMTAVIAGLVAVYLHLWKLGYMGPLVCNAQHSCEFVMTSQWGRFLGVDVALIGAVGYALILVTALVGLQAAMDQRPAHHGSARGADRRRLHLHAAPQVRRVGDTEVVLPAGARSAR